MICMLLHSSHARPSLAEHSSAAPLHAQAPDDAAGVLTSDPRIVQSARPVPLLTYEEATELAFFGATVLHPLAMQPAIQSNSLCVRVKNSFNRCPPCQQVQGRAMHHLQASPLTADLLSACPYWLRSGQIDR